MVKAGLYKDEQEALQWLVHDQAEQKISKYSKKIAEMEQKYGMDFSAFEKKIHSRAGEENFEEWMISYSGRATSKHTGTGNSSYDY